MAILCGDESALGKVMNTEDPVAMMEAGHSIRKESTKWIAAKWQTMKDGVQAKFDQNPDLQAFLKKTGMTRIAEASANDIYWAIGKGFNDKTRGDQAKWSDNTMGKILE